MKSRGGDLLGAEVLVEEQQHLELARREALGDRLRDDAVRRAALAHLLHQPARDRARERRLAVGDAAQEVDDPLGRLVLQQVAGGAEADRAEQVRVVLGRGQDDDRGVGRGLADPRQRGEAVHSGHRQVEDDEVGLQLGACSTASAPSVGLPDDLEPFAERSPASASRVSGWSSAMRTRVVMTPGDCADTGSMRQARRRDTFETFLSGEVVLVALLGAALALFLSQPTRSVRRTTCRSCGSCFSRSTRSVRRSSRF